MYTKLKSFYFKITPEITEGKDIFPSYSVYEFFLKEGISDLYYGKLFFYATNSLKASDLQKLIGKMINIEIEISDNLHAPDKDNKNNQDFDFKRLVNGIISSVKYLGKTIDVTTKADSKPANIFEIDFTSPFEILKGSNYKYHDLTYGKLQDKLGKFLSTPEKIIYGEDYKGSEYLSIKYELLDSTDKKLFSSLPDNICIQIGNYTPLLCLRKLITDFGLNFNIVHTVDENNKKIIKVFLSKGYGVHKSNGVESSYFDGSNSEKLNYDIGIVCDQTDSGSPKLNSFNVDVNTQDLEIYDNNNDFLIYATTTDNNEIKAKTNAQNSCLKNLNNKSERERMIYRLTASHLIFIPGAVISAKNYIDGEVKLIVDNVNLHILAGLNNSVFTSSKKQEPSIEETICAYELDKDKEPGSFADFFDTEKITATPNREIQVTSKKEIPVVNVAPKIEILEAVVTDGAGNSSGFWPAPNDDPSLKEPIEGAICICAGDNTLNPSMFYALPSGKNNPVQVKLTSTVPNTEIFNIPRIGQKVLILSGNNNYYLHSFLSQKNSSTVTEANKADRNNRLATVKGFASHCHGARVHVWDPTDISKNTGIKGYQVDESKYSLSKLSLEKNTDIKQYVKNKILDGTEASIIEDLISQDNTYKYYQDYSGEKAFDESYLVDLNKADCKPLSESSIKKRCQEIKKLVEKTKKESKETDDKLNEIQKKLDSKNKEMEIINIALNMLSGKEKESKQKEYNSLKSDYDSLTKDKNEAEKKQQEKKKAAENALKGLDAITNEFIGVIGYPDNCIEKFNDVFKIDHEGNLEINCPKGTVKINAESISLSSLKSTSVTGSGSITLTSPGSIKMGCAGTTLSIASSAIKACSMPFANGSMSSFGSTLTLDAFEGTAVKAPAVNISGKFLASVKDGVGAGLNVSKGVSGLSGTEACMSTCTLEKAILNVVKFDTELVSELANTITVNANPEASKYEKGVLDGILFPVLNEGLGFYYDSYFTKYLGTKNKTTGKRENGAIQKYKEGKTKAENSGDKDAYKRTVARFVVDTCDFICKSLDLTSKAMNIILVEPLKMSDKEGEPNWFEKKGAVGKNNAQDIKYFFASLKYTLNTISIHAVVAANTWGVKAAKIEANGGAVSISSTTKTDAVISEIKARA